LNTLLIRITTDSEIPFLIAVAMSKKTFHALSWMTAIQTVPNIAMNQGMSIVKQHGERQWPAGLPIGRIVGNDHLFRQFRML
jgi:hypothetical protein